ncbi:hypothetical protein SPRG_03382 [Saprolegnia parasitica CBS 223.65]|uniref:Uncharacterized protein n=1 Tax=Saprolegnia parasitica (strain CBS 223.65) TaxID=695850 RepID=A0A067D0B2_SAPPC|nr:hypothetical protein SPRG_03382 [Saprolegnia parasitica CBS 223.65]KDO32166.1 hypothetical protein SPRG_03382 [Saprolegnia parasitica CBS 223.65]|eukprot:XP_012197349.1 hypothetical protein SPRG_03382 [Saprolegnia parasitica CBS 223.65]
MCLLASAALLISGVVLVAYGAIYVSYHAQRMENVAGLRFVPNAAANPAGYAAFLASPTLGVQGLEPQTRSYYVFNITNIDAVVAGTAVPHVQQVGPYVYNQTSTKNSVRFNGSTVSYSVGTTFVEVPSRSNGSSSDFVYTVNTSYARTLAKLENAGFSERLLVAAHAQTQLSAYVAYLEGPMLAFTKQRLALPYLATMAQTVRTNALPSALTKFQAQVASQTLPQNLLRLIATTRQAYIPTLLRPMYEAFLVNYVPTTLSSHVATLQVQSVPRVLSNVQARLAVEAVPTILAHRQAQLRSTAVPVVLSRILDRLPTYIAFPYFARDMMEEACLEAVPSMLSTLKAGVVQAYIDQGASSATAQQNTVLQWLSAAGPWTNLDAMVGGNPTGQPRYGFELRPSLGNMALSTDVGNLLLGATTNLDFSLLEYSATDPTHGFGLWKQVVAMDEAAITALIAGVNNEVALPANYITRSQVLGVRAYILSWSKGAMLHRDRQRYWATTYAQRTAGSANEPSVDVDWVTPGVQPGFTLPSTNLGLSDAQCAKLWDATLAPSFLTPTGYVTWTSAAASDSAAATTLRSTFGLSSSQLDGVLAWIQALTSNASVKTKAIRHWGLGGTCPTPFNNVSSCATYQLEPTLVTSVSGWELPNTANLVFSEALAAYLWDATQLFSFLHLASGYNSWVNVLLLPTGLSSLTASLTALNLGTVSEDHVRLVAIWLQSWSHHPLLAQAMDQTWRDPATYPFLPSTTLASLTTYHVNRPALSAAAAAYLNSPSSAYAAINSAGYAAWMRSPSSAQVSAMLASINAQLPVFCAQLLGGANSALFATPLLTSCSDLTTADMTALQTYVQSQRTDAYMLQALRDQWRCGIAHWNLEPYRSGLQIGWELCRNSSCNLSLVNGTTCAVPSAAASLWDAANALSFLNPAVYQTTWLAAQSSDAAIAAPAKATIVAGLGQASWLPWMDVISQWLASWATLDYTNRDVLGLWLKAACTAPTQVSQTPVTTTTATASCVPSTTTTSDAVQYTNLVVGGRPTTYFVSNFAETSYTDTPTVAISTATTVVTCTSTTTTTTATTTTVTNGPICLHSDVTPGLPLLQHGFELGAVTSTITMTLVQQFLWNPANPASFLNMTALNTLWVPAATNATKVAALAALLPGASLADVTTIVQWLRAWRTNQLMSLFAQTQWINPSTSLPPFNLDPSGATIQTGFELRFTSTEASTYPSLVQAQYLWSSASAYSFLNTATGFPTWVQAYAGPLPASEALVDPLARAPTTTRTTQTASASAIATLQSATGLSAAQIQTISKWLVNWANHPFLWGVLLSQWVSKTTVFASTPSTLNLAALDASGAMTSLTGFELATPTSVTFAQARQLWNVANATSFLNPNVLVLWCFCHPQITAACPHLSDATGQLPATANASAASALTRFASLAPGFQMSSAPTAALAQTFVSLATGLTPADVTTVSLWLFQTPQSSFYQFLLQSQWATAGLPLYPKNAGYELAFIFNLTATTPRNATSALLVPNTPTPCAPIDAVVAAQLWQPASTTSFLHSAGLSAWLSGTIVVPGLAACQKTQVTNWLLSWQGHPFLRQLTEYSWYSTPLPCTQSLFGCERGFELALPTSLPSPTTLPTLGSIAAVVWDAQSPLSFLHPTGGLLWKTLLLGPCGSTFANGTCAPATLAPASASSYLVGQLASALGVSVSDVRTCVYLIGQVWLLQLLDNPGFVSYALAATGGAPSLLALPMQQFVNASVLSINASATDVGVVSQFDASTYVQWNATSHEFFNATQPALAGIPELSVYCARAPSVFGVAPSCALHQSYTLDHLTAHGLLHAFNDMTIVRINGVSVARGVVVLDAFLAQPFESPDACAAAASRITSIFPTLVASTAARCSSVGPSYLLILPGVAPLELTAVAPILDLQAYLKYTATTFGYAASGGLYVQTSVDSLLWQNSAARRLRPTATITLANLGFGTGDVLTTAITANVSDAPTSKAVQTYTFNTDTRAGFYGCLVATNGELDANNCTTSDGSVFARGATPSTLTLRSQSQARDVDFKYTAQIPWIGVPTRRYVEATPALTNVSHLYDDLPLLSSSPHLHNVTPTVPFATGLAPNAKMHTMLLDIEPISGTTLHRRDAWMLSIATGPTWLWHQGVQPAYVPLTWVLQEQAIPSASASLYRDLTAPGPMAPEKVAIWELVLGLAFVGLGIYALRLLSRARYKDTLLIKPVAEMPPMLSEADVHATDDALPDKTKAI